MKWLHWNEISSEKDLESFVYGPDFSTLRDEDNTVSSVGLIYEIEIIEGNSPHDYLVMFISHDNSTLVEIYDYRREALIIKEIINSEFMSNSVVKLSKTLLYFKCKNKKSYLINSEKFSDIRNKAIYLMNNEEFPLSIEQKLSLITNDKISKLAIYGNYLISVFNGKIEIQNITDGKYCFKKKISDGIINDFTYGGNFIFCACTGRKNGFPDSYSEIVIIDINILKVVYRIETELSYHASIACTSDGLTVACHNKDWSFRMFKFIEENGRYDIHHCYSYRTAGHPSILKFSPDNKWFFYGNDDGINAFVSKKDITYLEYLRIFKGKSFDFDYDTDENTNQIFISYAHEDFEFAKKLYYSLKDSGIEPWLDKENLMPGQKWKETIVDSIRTCRYFIALISCNSISKKGFVQKELKEALEVLEEYPESGIFVIPVRLDDCNISHRVLKEIHWVDMFPDWENGLKKIMKVINKSFIVKSSK